MHECLVACYNEGYLPDDWLISETFCIFKGKGKWQDPDRWRPIAMSNSVYRLFMRCGEDAGRTGEDAGRIGEDAGRMRGGCGEDARRMHGGLGRMRG